MGKKITQYPASAGNPDVTSLIDISEFDGSIYTSKKLTITQLIDFLNTNLNLGSSFTFKNNTGDTISKGMAVELSGASGLDLPEIALLSSSFSNVGLSQIFIANEDILNGNSGTFIQNGFLDNWYTVGLTVGQKIFWDVASQSLTVVGTDIDQVFVGICTVVDANGQLFVSPTRGTRTLTSQLINDGSDTINPYITALDIPTVPTLTSELTNDGDDTINPFITALDLPTVPTLTSDLTNDGADGLNPFITALDIPTFASADKMVTVGRNSTGSTLYKGTIVYILGSTGNRPNFVKARADVEATSAGTFGVIENNILNNADGNCVTIGAIDNLDTRSTATHPFTVDTLVDGDTIYLSPTTAGYITNVKPTAPDHLVYMGKVVRTSPTNGTIVYRIQNGYELQELHNVAISSVTNNDILQYETSTSLWKNKAIPTASGSVNGYLSSTDWTTFNNKVATTRTLTINGTTYDLSANRSWTVSGASGVFGITDSSGVYTYYATLILAMASATSGQTIELFSDYTETSGAVTLKNGVNINGNGHTYTLNKTGSNNTFTDGGVAVDCSIDNIKIIRTGGTTSLTDNVCLSLSGASNIKTTAIFSTTGALCILLNNANCYLNGGKSYVINYSGVYVTLGNLSNHYVELNSNSSHYGIYCASGTLINCHGISKGSVYFAVIQIDGGTATNCSAISTTAGGYASAFVNSGNSLNCSGHSISVGGFKNNGKAENCSGFSTSSTGFVGSGGSISLNCSGFSISGVGLSGYNGQYIDCNGYSTGNYGIIVSNGNDGQVHVLNCTAMSTAASGAAFGYYPNNGGIKNCTIKTLYNSSAGHGVELSALNSVTGCNIQVTSASANCIYKSTAGTVKYASNTFEGATTAVNANITQGVTNVHDLQGNILI